MKRKLLYLLFFFLSFQVFGQSDVGLSIEVGSGVSIPFNENRAASMAVLIESRYSFKKIGFGLRFEKNIVGFGIDEYHFERLELNGTSSSPYDIWRGNSLKQFSSTLFTFDIYPEGFENNIRLNLGLGYFSRSKIPRQEIEENINLDLGQRIRFGGSFSLYYRYKKINSFVRLNLIHNKGLDDYNKLNNYWSFGSVYDFKIKNGYTNNYKYNQKKKRFIQFEIGYQLTAPISQKSQASSLNLFGSVGIFLKERLLIKLYHYNYQKKLGIDQKILENIREDFDFYIVVRSDHNNIISKVSSTNLVGSLLINKSELGYFSLGLGIGYTKNQFKSIFFNDLNLKKSTFNGVLSLGLNSGYVSHHLNAQVLPGDIPVILSYQIGLSFNIRKKKKYKIMKTVPSKLKYILLCLNLLLAISVSATIEVISENNATDGLCNGSITIQATGDAAPFTLLFEGNGEQYLIPGVNGNYTFYNLCAGDYTITVSSGASCEKVLYANLVECFEIDLGQVIITEPSTCNNSDGAIYIAGPITGGTPPYSYSWTNGQTTNPATNLGTGIYYLTVKDKSGCTARGQYAFQSAGVPSISGITSNTCEGQNGGSIETTVSNNNGSTNFSYNWSNNASSPNLNNLPAGGYNLTVTDNDSGCTTWESFTINGIPSNGALSISPIIQRPCTDGGSSGSIIANVVNGTPPYTYSWGGGETTPGIYNLSAGSYNVTITDFCNDVLTRSFTLNEEDLIVDYDITPPCSQGDNGTVTFTPSSGIPPYTYIWWPENLVTQLNIIDRTPGLQSVTITDAVGCSTIENFLIPYSSSVISITTPPSLVIPCNSNPNGGTIVALVAGQNGPFEYQWSFQGGSEIISTQKNLTGITTDATYCLTVTDNCGNSESHCHFISCSCISSMVAVNDGSSSCSDPNGIIKVDNECLEYGESTSISIANEYCHGWSWPNLPNPLPNPPSCTYQLTVTWPDGTIGQYSIDTEPNGYSVNEINFIGGVPEYIVDYPDIYEIKLKNACGCEIVRTLNIGPETRHYEGIWENYNENEPSLPELNVMTGCRQYHCCGAGLVPDYINLATPGGNCNFIDQAPFQFLPGTIFSPCSSGGTIICPTSPEDIIGVPQEVWGQLVINWDEPIVEDCIYTCGCLFAAEDLDLTGVEDFVYVETIIQLSLNCVDDEEDNPVPPSLICDDFLESTDDFETCTTIVTCPTTGETTVMGPFYENVCFQGGGEFTPIYIYARCLLDPNSDDWEEFPFTYLTINGTIENPEQYTDEELGDLLNNIPACEFTFSPPPPNGLESSNTNNQLNQQKTPVQTETNNNTISEITVFPNPFKNELNIQINSATEEQIQIEFFDVLGRIVYSKEHSLSIGENELKITPNAEWNAGLYNLLIRGEEEIKGIFKVVRMGNESSEKE